MSPLIQLLCQNKMLERDITFKMTIFYLKICSSLYRTCILTGIWPWGLFYPWIINVVHLMSYFISMMCGMSIYNSFESVIYREYAVAQSNLKLQASHNMNISEIGHDFVYKIHFNINHWVFYIICYDSVLHVCVSTTGRRIPFTSLPLTI